jgi:two-component system cell cycle response regulator DivK
LRSLGGLAPRAIGRSERVKQLSRPQSMMMELAKPDLRRPKKVLIVEDNDLNMKLFNDLLVAHGYGTLQTKDGVEALALARQHRPDLILMDIQLPEVSGLQVTQWIKGDDDLRMIPIIAVTAFAMKGDEEKIRDGGCEAYIAKPISVANFMRTVERFLT